jgi:hypothetical protein
MPTPPDRIYYNDGPAPSYSLHGDPASATGTAPRTSPGTVLACARCRNTITRRTAAIEVSGAHVHNFTNPDGLRFRIGCFGKAYGAEPSGAPTTYFTWFPGYAWQAEHCSACAIHLGWRFRKTPSEIFHGLILDQLVEVEE